jgi:glycosyltransferase involved in cell wall biosynthesis
MKNIAGQSKRLRILIVAHAFPPMNAIGSHRPYSWARFWRDEGHEIHVLTPSKHDLDGMMDMERDLRGICVHEVSYLPMRASHAGILRAGTHSAVGRWEWLKTITRRARFSLAMFGDPRLLAYRPMVRKGMEILRGADFDFIIATSPPEVCFFVARTLSRRTGVPWVADFRDAWFHNLRLYHTRLSSSLAGPVNQWLVDNASALVTVSRGLQERLSSYLGREVFLSYNGFFAAERNSAPPTRPWNDNKLHIAYTGRVHPGKQDPAPLFRALASLGRLRGHLAHCLSVDFYGFDRLLLRPLIERHGVEDCVTLCGFVPYQDSINVQRAADVLLFLDWTDGRGDGMLTGKLLEYLGSGRPILALGVRKDSEAARLIAETGCGATLTDEEEIVGYLQHLLVSGRPAAVGSAACDALSRERQASVLLDKLRGCLF